LLLIHLVVTDPELHGVLSTGLYNLMSAAPIAGTLYEPERAQLADVLSWAFSTIFVYLLLPLAIIRWGLREELNTYGVQRGNTRGWRKLCTLVAIPTAAVIGAASFLPAFTKTYPFFIPSESWLLFVLWEIVYGAQIVAVEFFYRGFILHGLKRRYGFAAIWLMLIPYVFIHFPKPLPETLASIVAGLTLGIISLRTGSILIPVFLHLFMAWWMDLLALAQRGGLG